MLPSDSISEDTENGVLHFQDETIAQPIDVSATGPSLALNLQPNAQNLEYLALPETTLVTDNNRESWPEPLPFSTPGPGSLLDSSVTSNTDISLLIPKKNLSLVFYTNETRIGSDLLSNLSHTPLYSSDSLSSDPCIKDSASDITGSSWKPSLPKEDRRSLLSNVYSTPGSRYCAPRPVHFDSPFEDPISSKNSLQPGYEIDYDTIDFHWKPFDRKHLVSDRLQKPIYTSGSAHSNCACDTFEYEQAVKAVNTEISTLNPPMFPGPASPLLPVSPTPFRFLVPP